MDVFAALADPVRRDLLAHLAEEGTSRVVDLTRDRGISRPAVSRHLRVLSAAGLVSATERGRERHYALDTTPLTQVDELLGRLRHGGGYAAAQPPVSATALDALDLEVRRTVRDRSHHAGERHTDDTTTDTEESA
ncbi:Transcriptional regulator, ArsR family [Serinicoccus hydrothermalis]|uniref:Transcriptional regulator, ArsR family n=1 Tax=Serinicoccus hydrothermalis TaxID=1758689 RepID=A0A1B1NDG5_9MICO|nr:metalloregulator ArsR/SmtB family transcription factor [Serinicoccus hydrothermalis]ANS79473.1 Transcriptional regulator, ArsR family [Serinicoccus hydrothermalis]